MYALSAAGRWAIRRAWHGARPRPVTDAGRRAAWSGLGAVRQAVAAGEGRLADVGQRRLVRLGGGLELGHAQDLLLVQRLVLQQRPGQAVQRVAVDAQQVQRLLVAVAQDALHLFVDDPRRVLAVRLGET